MEPASSSASTPESASLKEMATRFCAAVAVAGGPGTGIGTGDSVGATAMFGASVVTQNVPHGLISRPPSLNSSAA
jgi:hypothetical protein